MDQKSKKAYNRWMVAYTLVRNTQLQTLTASRLQAKRADSNDVDTYTIEDSPSFLSSAEYKAVENPYTTYPEFVGSQDPINFS